MQASHRLPKLTRCAFQLIADTIKNANICSADRSTLTADFTSVLYTTNKNFNADRFRTACQPAEPLVVCASKVYSGLGADIVMESLHS
jgi:hypothetical protein